MWLALTIGCGAAPEERRPPPEPPGAPVGLVGWAVIRPAAAEATLDGLDARMAEGGGALGEAWARSRAAISDGLAESAPGRGPDPWAAWGLDRETPIRVAVAAPDGPSHGRALLAALEGGVVVVPPARVRGRVVARPIDSLRLVDGLDRVARRLGWTVDPRGSDRWRGHDPTSGASARLRLIGEHAVLDVTLPAGGGAADEVEAQPWPASGEAPVELGVSAAGLTALEVALGASRALERVEGRPAADARPVLLAAADVLTACTRRWDAAGAVVEGVRVAVDAPGGRLRLTGEVRLTARGARAWVAARRPLPLGSLEGLPAAAQAGIAPAVFAAVSGLDAGWFDEARRCAAGDGAWALLPAIWPALADVSPGVAPPGGWPAGAEGFAVALPDAAGEAPTLATLRVIGSANAAAVGRAAVEAGLLADGPTRWSLGGDVPLVVGAVGDGGEAVAVGLGRDAFSALAQRWAPIEAGAVLDARLDPAALGAWFAVGGGAPGGGLGVWRLRVTLDDALRFVLVGGGELDRSGGAQ